MRDSQRSRRQIGVALVVGLVALAGAALVFVLSDQPSATDGYAANGLIAYSHDGDLFVGDPVTGATRIIVSGDSHINPVFSPDGSHIAFLRGDPSWGASLHVVRPDGSDEREIVPLGFSDHPWIGPFAWTPDGRGLIVGVDRPPYPHPYSDGDLVHFDVAGRSEPKLLTPPLPSSPGAQRFNPSAQVAPMVRPPDGDVILAPASNGIETYDADLQPGRRLEPSALVPLGPYGTSGLDLSWSPDGKRIAFGAWHEDTADTDEGGSAELYVMDADGTDVRRVGTGWLALWSPDGRQLAYEPWVYVDPPDMLSISVYDLDSGLSRSLTSSRSPKKVGADVSTVTSNAHHTWFFEGWSWSPDGRSLLVLRDYRTRPIVIDVASDVATELPWVTDSNPTWQKVTTAKRSARFASAPNATRAGPPGCLPFAPRLARDTSGSGAPRHRPQGWPSERSQITLSKRRAAHSASRATNGAGEPRQHRAEYQLGWYLAAEAVGAAVGTGA